MLELNLILLTNIAASHYNLGNFPLAENFSSQVLKLKPKHFKALYRRALCYYELKKYE
jgi:tetratricopeptide (TPR) repeat protein